MPMVQATIRISDSAAIIRPAFSTEPDLQVVAWLNHVNNGDDIPHTLSMMDVF